MHWSSFRTSRLILTRFVIQVNAFNAHGKRYLSNVSKPGNDPSMMNLPQPTPILNKLHYHSLLFIEWKLLSLSRPSPLKSHVFRKRIILIFSSSRFLLTCVFRAPMKFRLLFSVDPNLNVVLSVVFTVDVHLLCACVRVCFSLLCSVNYCSWDEKEKRSNETRTDRKTWLS